MRSSAIPRQEGDNPNPCREYLTHLSQNTVFHGRHPRQPHPPPPGRAAAFNECPTPRESRVTVIRAGRVGTRGSGCTVPMAGTAPRHVSPVPRGLRRRCFVISINHGNHTPGLWGRTEVGSVPLGAVTVTKGTGLRRGMWGGWHF